MDASVALHLPRDGHGQNQWDYALSALPPARIYVIGNEADRPQSNIFAPLPICETVHDIPTTDTTSIVVLAPSSGRHVQGSESLTDFSHPAEALYVFGDDKSHMDAEVGAIADHLVYIPTDSHHELYSWTAYAITMWDRRMKADG